MKPPRKPHPVDFCDIAIIREAIEFSAALFLGRGQYARARAPSLIEIKAAATRLEAEHPGRRALIYAINLAGRSAVITPDLEALMQEQVDIFTASYSAKSAAVRALKRSGFEPDQAEVQKEGARFVIRKPAKAKRFSMPDPADVAGAIAAEHAAGPRPKAKALGERAQARADRANIAHDMTEALARVRERDAAAAVVKAAAKAKPAARTAEEAARDKAASKRLGAAMKMKGGQIGAAEAKPRAQAKGQARGARAQAPADAEPRRNAAYKTQRAAAANGQLPREPDFSAQTHAPYRKRLAAITEAAKARDIAALKAMEIRPYNSSMVPLARYRDLCVTALEASA